MQLLKLIEMMPKPVRNFSIGGVVIGALFISHELRYAQASTVSAMEQSGRVNTIQNWIRAAREEGQSDFICDAIDAELIALCSDNPKHYLCKPETQKQIREKAGCE